MRIEHIQQIFAADQLIYFFNGGQVPCLAAFFIWLGPAVGCANIFVFWGKNASEGIGQRGGFVLQYWIRVLRRVTECAEEKFGYAPCIFRF